MATEDQTPASREAHETKLRVEIFAPRHPKAKRFEFSPNTLVGAAAAEAAKEFGYEGGTPGLQTNTSPPRTLDNNQSLAQAGVKDHEELELTDTGGGV